MKKKFRTLSLIVATVLVVSASLIFASCGKADNLVKKEVTTYANSTLRIETTYQYDKNNRLKETLETSGEDSGRETVKSVYYYVGDLLMSRENYHQKEDGSWEQSFYHAYGYNEMSKLVSTIGYGVENNKKELFAMDLSEYDANGNKTKVSSFMYDEGDLIGSMTVEFEYNDKKQMTKEKYYEYDMMEDELVYSGCYTFEYDENGNETALKYYTAEDELTTVERFTYDNKGNKTLAQTYAILEGGAESLCAKTDFEYDSKNRLTKETTYYPNEETGELELQYSTTYEY